MKEYKYTINGNQYQVAIEEAGETTAKAIVNGTEYIVEWEKPKEEKPVVKVKPAAAPKPATAAPAAAPAAAPVSGNAIKTPLPGVIIDVKVSVGDTVKKGDTVVVLEAMKMENNINADRDGKVVSIAVSKGDTVADGAPLVILE
ncbi:MAG: acetyl-CoA carboxylase biotin carboxyl carrier protein subunit [Bacteroidales bacterium]|nr:acetyl-CoA carboxylase biotin carboxyl carrier protein subunit [Bacteroidales bacterium]MBO5262816.1 acetyl-CoA carboxylase biotin carboxyl carrier protein subunit [Bacteroidaceae bacterium]